MATYNKKIELNGKQITVKAGFGLDLNMFTTVSDDKKTVHSNPTYSVYINGVEYKNVFTSICTENKKTGRASISYICNKTGIKFANSDKKLIEYILNK
jgi:hypothetical protein